MVTGFSPVASGLTQTNRLRGHYPDSAPRLERDGPQAVKGYFDQYFREHPERIRVVDYSEDGSVTIAMYYYVDLQDHDNDLTTTISFIRNPESLHGVTHNIVGSTQFGCNHPCLTCKDGLPKSFKGHMVKEHMFDATARIIWIADQFAPIADDATIELLQTGQGDPLRNGFNVAPFFRHLHLVDSRIVRAYSSTAGALHTLTEMIDAANVAKGHGIIISCQFSLHTPFQKERAIFMPGLNTKVEDLLQAAKRFHDETNNPAYINYIVIRGWNDSPEHAEALARMIPEGCILKLVALNSVKELVGERDDYGNVYVSDINPDLEGTPDIAGKPIHQIQIPKAFQIELTPEEARHDVWKFRERIDVCGRGTQITSPEDKAGIVGADCGMVSNGKGNNQHKMISVIRPPLPQNFRFIPELIAA